MWGKLIFMSGGLTWRQFANFPALLGLKAVKYWKAVKSEAE